MVSINTNVGNMRAQDALSQSHGLLQISLERLSTGVRINRAEDDAAGLIVRDRFQSQMNGFTEAIRNIQTAQSMIQVAEQGINQITTALQTMRALAVRAADDNLNDSDRRSIQEQIKGLLREINGRAQTTVYNGHNLLDGSITDSHPERRGSTQIQTNSFLANGQVLVGSTGVTGTNATLVGGISQGSYEVKIVFSAQAGVLPSETSKTTLSGSIDSPTSLPNNVTTLAQNVTDRNGGAHAASFTFTELGTSRNYTYSVSVAGGGVYGAAAQTFSGTMMFNNDGRLAAVDGITSAPFTRTVTLADGTSGGQTYTVDFSGLVENQHDATATTASATSNGANGTPTTAYAFNAGDNLSNTHVVSDAVTSAADTFIDRTGATHSVSTTFNLASSDAAGTTWNYSLNGLAGGVWTGANSGNATGTLHFNTLGALDAINGGAVTPFNLVVGDGTPGGQILSVDLTQLVSNAGADATAATVTGTTLGNPTTQVQMANNIVNGSTPVDVFFNVVDRTGTNSTTALPLAQQPRVTFSQVGSTNTWNYTVTPPSGSGFSGLGTNLQGQVTFNAAGNLVSLDGTNTLTKTVNFNDGTPEGQNVAIDFSQLNMARATGLSATGTDGGSGTSTGELNAIIYYDDANSPNSQLNPISTLLGIDLGTRSYNAGGISFTVNTASSLDVGLVSYVKAYTYISAVKEDRALQFHVGPDEGMVQRIGIAKMDVQTLFRGHNTDADYSDVDLSNTLKAQDMIGQVDDALNFVSAENLKVGQFANNISRTLDLQRQNNTSISNAFSLLNDSDMAQEATNQSKRSILIQSGTAMVAQSNTTSQFILQLLR